MAAKPCHRTRGAGALRGETWVSPFLRSRLTGPVGRGISERNLRPGGLFLTRSVIDVSRVSRVAVQPTGPAHDNVPFSAIREYRGGAKNVAVKRGQPWLREHVGVVLGSAVGVCQVAVRSLIEAQVGPGSGQSRVAGRRIGLYMLAATFWTTTSGVATS